ncbi:hypothetical protein AB3331_09440 [Streptococcus sp. H49]|uniref:hypothetical protein n=1 Tax=Streptococcus huangxiaojuni TaxID=3237239 RepID=UPI0034A35416
MIATVRLVDDTGVSTLCELDLMRFSEGQVRERMRERGFKDDSFFVCAFSDWGVDRVMSLREAYQLKRYIISHCSGDEQLMIELLKQHWSVTDIVNCRFTFIGEGDLVILKRLFEGRSTDNIARIVHAMGNCADIITIFAQTNKLLLTQKGAYLIEDMS